MENKKMKKDTILYAYYRENTCNDIKFNVIKVVRNVRKLG